FSAFRPWGECAILPPPLISLLPLSSNFVSTTFTISLLSFRLLDVPSKKRRIRGLTIFELFRHNSKPRLNRFLNSLLPL
ncbi:uncharacterized protein N7487_002300, partial [Penicillium crustosum]|uniref:uncharacterized protein n=1 Tax=Penicillium crustosum TaxID=36656 RepID=UPI002391B77C